MDNYQHPKPGKTYISPALPAFGDKTRRVRIASKVLASKDGYEYVKERDEVVVRRKPDAATYIRAKFLEDTKGVFVLTIQKFSADTGMPYGAGFSFVGEEIGRFCEFLANIQAVSLENGSSVNISDAELRKIALTSRQAKELVVDNEELIAEVLRHSVTKRDLVALGYRKRQLEVFGKLLESESYFNDLKKRKKCKDEALWQQFFEANQWIFGYGLSYIYSSGLDDKNLEQVVRGYQVDQPGKRVDALLKTRALASTLCFVEIKTHRTPLLASSDYRRGCWAPSEHLSGAVAQVQGTVSYAGETILGRLCLADKKGFPTAEEAFNFSPRSFVVVGTLGQFSGEHGVNEGQLRSFELYRRNLHQPEVITFDELYERARHIVGTSEG
ncbi:Shedu immune nuclease family protein [Stenotrophomonas maltophilia]|uniref:Shedu immune nuclease family protein n=1 Tax=Stenotrophomonas maltophilia TaxID=40324 RepID=UPI000DA70BF6|nr:Shedu immune nuclease family protein [Stenotrophomonas maltophilia]